MRLEEIYDSIVALQAELEAHHDDPELCRPDYRKIRALAATYDLQEYLADEIAKARDLCVEFDEDDDEDDEALIDLAKERLERSGTPFFKVN